jgi:serine/threonine protein phosphatase PrpC
MGVTLPKVVDSTIVERHESKGFRVAACEMNGWRQNMEDAHVVHICKGWGFFGVFDGHGGDQCAKYVAPRIERELKEKGCPADDDAVRKMMFEIDQEYLDGGEDSGSTATMCIIHKPVEEGAKHVLRVINAGDSRVLLGKRDGTICDGGGTDQGLTTDHKPDNDIEKERIYRCGGTVEHTQAGGCARVNGDLAVCRGFGDRKYKQTGGPKPQDRPVTVDPELKRFECDGADFVLLVCDGVSEGDFSNEQVVKLVAEVLKESNDLGAAARAVCFEAVRTNSKDNISCMVVALDGEKDVEKNIEFRSGSVGKLSHNGYFKAYEAMAERAGMTVEEAVEKRYDALSELFQSESSLTVSGVKARLGSCEAKAGDSDIPELADLKEELESLGSPSGEPGSVERRTYFKKWVEELPKESRGSGNDLQMLMQSPDLIAALMGVKGKGKGKDGYGSSDDS